MEDYDYFDLDLRECDLPDLINGLLEAEREIREIKGWQESAKAELRFRNHGNRGKTIYEGEIGSIAVTKQEDRLLPDPKYNGWDQLRRELGAAFYEWFTVREVFNLADGAGARLSEAPKSVLKALKLHSRDARVGCRINKD